MDPTLCPAVHLISPGWPLTAVHQQLPSAIAYVATVRSILWSYCLYCSSMSNKLQLSQRAQPCCSVNGLSRVTDLVKIL